MLVVQAQVQVLDVQAAHLAGAGTADVDRLEQHPIRGVGKNAVTSRKRR
jgi:hypothetical protein